MKVYQTDSKVGQPFGNVYKVNAGAETEYQKGYYTCEHGTVLIYSEPTFSSFSFTYNGRLYSLSLNDLPKPLTDRQLLVRAGKFARETVKLAEPVKITEAKTTKHYTFVISHPSGQYNVLLAHRTIPTEAWIFKDMEVGVEELISLLQAVPSESESLYTRKLSPVEQSQVLGDCLGFSIEDGVVLDEEGDEFYGWDRNDKYDMDTLKGIVKYVSDQKIEQGQDQARYAIKKALGL